VENQNLWIMNDSTWHHNTRLYAIHHTTSIVLNRSSSYRDFCHPSRRGFHSPSSRTPTSSSCSLDSTRNITTDITSKLTSEKILTKFNNKSVFVTKHNEARSTPTPKNESLKAAQNLPMHFSMSNTDISTTNYDYFGMNACFWDKIYDQDMALASTTD